jgi:large subunit ribosomal protein L30
MSTDKTVKLTQVRSTAGRSERHKACIRGLGLRRIGHCVQVQDSPENRGMINSVSYLLKVEEA